MWHARNELINPRLIEGVENVAKSVKLLTNAGFDRDFAFVDTPGSIMPVITDALEAADLIVVPVQPGQLDLWGQDAVVDRIDRLGLINKMMFVLTRVQAGKGGQTEADKARRYLQRSPHPIPVMPERIDYRKGAEQGMAAWEVSKNKDIKVDVENIWKAMQIALRAAPLYGTEQTNVVPIAR
jgi:chromosome partitioning protein